MKIEWGIENLHWIANQNSTYKNEIFKIFEISLCVGDVS